jgi:hypothetical protein
VRGQLFPAALAAFGLQGRGAHVPPLRCGLPPSDAAAHVTGVRLPVDGGLLASI